MMRITDEPVLVGSRSGIGAGDASPATERWAIAAAKLKGTGVHVIFGQSEYTFIEFGPAVAPGVYFSSFGSRWTRFSYALAPETTVVAVDRLLRVLSDFSS